MTKEQQTELVTTLCDELKKGLLSKVARVPDEWDGHELRLWFAEYARENFIMGTLMKGKRLREYRNTVLVENL